MRDRELPACELADGTPVYVETGDTGPAPTWWLQALGPETQATAAAAPAGSIPVDRPLLARPFRTSGHVIR